jgi:hypothetical protein
MPANATAALLVTAAALLSPEMSAKVPTVMLGGAMP